MPELVIRLKKKADGSAALTCIRADGSTTWQRQDGHLGAFFPLHDLTHYAVETTLGFRRAFYGLLADGWDISTFNEPKAADRLTEDASLAEVIVGFFDLERSTGVLANAEDFNWKIHAYFADKNLVPPAFRITDDQIAHVRRVRAELFARWRDVPAGDTLELSFDRSPLPV